MLMNSMFFDNSTYKNALMDNWINIMEEDRLLMYADNDELSDREKKGYATLAKYKGLI